MWATTGRFEGLQGVWASDEVLKMACLRLRELPGRGPGVVDPTVTCGKALGSSLLRHLELSPMAVAKPTGDASFSGIVTDKAVMDNMESPLERPPLPAEWEWAVQEVEEKGYASCLSRASAELLRSFKVGLSRLSVR